MWSDPRAATQLSSASSTIACFARSARVCTRKYSRATRPSRASTNVTSGRASAARRTASPTCALSVAVDLRNLRRAGTLKNSSRTSTVVPGAHPQGRARGSPPPSTTSSTPSSRARTRVASVSRETDPTLGSASPRKPNVPMPRRSSTREILLVAWRSRARRASSPSIPSPSSTTRMRAVPPCSISTLTRVAPASSAFSTSSFTTLAGRSTTSPAAIWFARSLESRLTFPIARATSAFPERTGLRLVEERARARPREREHDEAREEHADERQETGDRARGRGGSGPRVRSANRGRIPEDVRSSRAAALRWRRISNVTSADATSRTESRGTPRPRSPRARR